jgi:DNA polymerase I-like protein with 3'-5' exonuclease and polymerase domains
MIAELRANPEVRVLLLRALLTDEFLEMPARMIRVEDDIVQIKFDVSQLQADVSQLQADVSQLQADVSQLKIDVAELKGTNLEIKSVQRIQSIITQRLELRRPRTVHSLTAPMSGNPLDALQDAEELGRIRPGGDSEVLEADLIFSARRRADGEPV